MSAWCERQANEPGLNLRCRRGTPPLPLTKHLGTISTKTETRLGMAICHEIVQSLHGHIDMVQRRQNGQVVRFDIIVTLPL